MTESSVQQHIGEIARDLVALEINTILKPSITGASMPAVRHALMDIGREYYHLVCRVKGGDPPLDLDEERLGSYWAFDRIRTLAKQLQEGPERAGDWQLLQRVKDMSDQIKGVLEQAADDGAAAWDNNYSRAEIQGRANAFPHVVWITLPPPNERGASRVMSVRGAPARVWVTGPAAEYVLVSDPQAAVLGRASVLHPLREAEFRPPDALEDGWRGFMLPAGNYVVRAGEGEVQFRLEVRDFEQPPPLVLPADSIRVVRKAWELGVEEIALQTVVTLDGDVVTRIQPHRLAETTLREVHQRGVDVAVDFWQDLIGIATGILESLVRTALRR